MNFRCAKILFAAAIFCLGARFSAAEKPRVFVLTDIDNEPDDAMSLVRFLVYANQWDVEGLVATTSIHQQNKVAPERIRQIVAAYGQVLLGSLADFFGGCACHRADHAFAFTAMRSANSNPESAAPSTRGPPRLSPPKPKPSSGSHTHPFANDATGSLNFQRCNATLTTGAPNQSAMSGITIAASSVSVFAKCSAANDGLKCTVTAPATPGEIPFLVLSAIHRTRPFVSATPSTGTALAPPSVSSNAKHG